MIVTGKNIPARRSQPFVPTKPHQYNDEGRSDLSFRTSFINYTGREVTVGTRDGICYQLPARDDATRKSFIVRKEISISHALKSKVRTMILNHEWPEGEEMTRFKALFMERYADNFNGITMKVDYEVTLEDFKEMDGSMYHYELDLILSIKRNNIPLHPHCYAVENSPKTHDETFDEKGHAVMIVDNKGKIGKRFYRLFGQIVIVPPIMDKTKLDGFYLEHRGIVTSSTSESNSSLTFYPAEKMDEVPWLYKTYTEVINAPEQDAETALKLKELEAQSKTLMAENAIAKANNDKELLEKEKELTVLKSALAESERLTKLSDEAMQRRFDEEEQRSKLQQLRSKDYYEDRSTGRKDSSDMLKFIPTFIMGIGAALLAVSSFVK